MIRLLEMPREPYWLDLLLGVRVLVRPLTTALSAAARAAGTRRVRQLVEAEKQMPAAGATVDGLPMDQDGLQGLSQMIYGQALAGRAIIEWEGVQLPDGTPAPVTQDSVDALFRDVSPVAEDFLAKYSAPLEQMYVEGESSPPAESGTSAGGNGTATTAESSIPPVPEGSPELMGSSAPTESTSPAP